MDRAAANLSVRYPDRTSESGRDFRVSQLPQRSNEENQVRHPWTAWLEAASFAAEAQRVIALRMMRVAAGGAVAASETQRMLLEKVIANTQAQFAACMTLAAGRQIEAAARAAAKPYRKAVRANHRRLTRRGTRK